MQQMLFAVQYLHCHDIIHCNIEPNNLLIEAPNLLQLTGFEDARIERMGFRDEISAAVAAKEGLHVGRLPYRAIEILLCNPDFSFQVDLWSIGCVMWELAVKETVFPGKSISEVLTRVFS